MIIRLVHMTFIKEKVPQFLDLFLSYHEKISNAPGCIQVELIQEKNSPEKISTLSYWNSEEDLDNYRNSTLFADVWPKTKLLFEEKPYAVTYNLLKDSKI